MLPGCGEGEQWPRWAKGYSNMMRQLCTAENFHNSAGAGSYGISDKILYLRYEMFVKKTGNTNAALEEHPTADKLVV